MDFHTALNSVIAELTPRAWDYTDNAGTTLTVIPAGLREDPGCAEVYVRITRPDASGLAEFGITGPNSRGVAEVGIPTASLPGLIQALTERTGWAADLLAGAIAVIPGVPGAIVFLSEVHSAGVEVTESVRVPEAQRLPFASAHRRALDVARSWES